MTPPPPLTLTLCNYSFYKITLPQFKGQPELGGAGGTGGTLLLMSPLFYLDFFCHFFGITRLKEQKKKLTLHCPPHGHILKLILCVCLHALVCFRAAFVCARERSSSN